jgi:Rnl2 family RNA ligase
MRAEPLFIGKFESAFNYKIEFESTIPQILKLPTLTGNKAEGVVIKPVKSIYIETKKGNIRPIVKKKILEFAEDSRFHQANKWDYQKSELDIEALITQEILKLVTLNRLNNVISKIGRISSDKKHINQQATLLTELLIWDVLDSFNETEYETSFNNLSNQSQQLIMGKLEKAAYELVEDYCDSIN